MDRFAPQQKLAMHPQFAAYMAGERVYPINIEISPSGLCQATCNFCAWANGELGGHRNVFLESSRLMRLLSECAELQIKSVSWSGGGEPSLHPDIGEAVRWANDLGLQQGMFTNSLAEPKYDPSLMQWIRVTITDRPIREDYVKMLRPAKTLGIAFNYAGPQDDEKLRDTLLVAERCGVTYLQVRPALKYNGETVDIKPPTFTHPLMQVTEYKFREAKKHHGYAQCEAWHFSVFAWEDGNVDTCSYMRKHPGYTLGNLYDRSLREILDKAPHSVPVHEQCQNCCRPHEMNKLIHSSRELLDKEFP